MAATCLGVATSTVMADGGVDAKLTGDPAVVAEKAFQSGDRRHIVIPVCGSDQGEVLPGWPLHESPAHLEALERGRRPITCADLGDDPKRRNFVRAAHYAERYNRRLLELEGKGPK